MAASAGSSLPAKKIVAWCQLHGTDDAVPKTRRMASMPGAPSHEQ
jgi:hypothetical protein